MLTRGVTWQEVLFQSLIAFFVLFVLARLLGKRQVAQLTMFDYIAGITIGNIAAAWSLDEVRSIHAVISLLVWTGLVLLLAWIQRKSYRARVVLDGRPTVVIEGGKVLEENLKKANLSIEELMLLLRRKDVFKLADVEYAVFETNGELSVLKKTSVQPLTPKDAGMLVMDEAQPRLVVIDGHVMNRSLEEAGYTKAWLLAELNKLGARDFSDVFMAQVDAQGNVYADLYQDAVHRPQVPERPLLLAHLKKMQADFELWALETVDKEAKALYERTARQLNDLVHKVEPLLRR
ncbi:hypothetical protein GCM10010885_13200 [Alicyclobacillus cellulosilyticus]|uniref:DUF421 domain-containing protein n=1 Tax=Alicyclobacillus cellulosilyticus TaxID=1003997 RepID=A0A917NJM6_9BACL|nr:DUF421 domain-containing protein [Alicyclobacillus cellulosilyticus]GGJ05454.1 hypothetical protein GCM10010885_13200 [Alicyclobacillus cellulosilyticus]